MWQRSTAWRNQDRAYEARTPTAYAERHTRSVLYLRWISTHWKHIRVQAKKKAARLRLPSTGDWQTAVRIVQRTWPGTYSWMLSCSKHEGGYGRFVMNTQGSGAGGWLQYMQGTFDSHYSKALSLARTEHRPVPPAGQGWTSPLAQAFAGGWGYFHNRSAWSGDPWC